MDIAIVVPSKLVDTIISAAPSAVVSEADDDGALGLGQSATLFIALHAVWKSAKEIATKLAPFYSRETRNGVDDVGTRRKGVNQIEECVREPV